MQTQTKWLLVIHRVPAKPDYLRVKVGRRLRELGAVAIKNSVYVVPAAAETRAKLSGLTREVIRQGAEAIVCEAQFVEGITDGSIEDLVREARDSEYETISKEAKRLAAGLRGKRSASEPRRREAGRKLERLRTRFDQVVSRDPFGAAGRDTAAGLLSLLEDRVQGVEEEGGRADLAEPPKGATWVTRTGVMVDRVASAWLIRRFIDPASRFKFVPGRGYRSRPDEIRFDMAGAEFTHRDGRCTFEVLLEDFRIGDSALRAIGEIVHDLDLEDGKFGRPEAAGVDRMIVGLAIATQSDEERLVRGGGVFDTLYESFRRKGR